MGRALKNPAQSGPPGWFIWLGQQGLQMVYNVSGSPTAQQPQNTQPIDDSPLMLCKDLLPAPRNLPFSVCCTPRKQSVSHSLVGNKRHEKQSFVDVPDLRQQRGKLFVLQAKCKHLL